MCAAAVRGLSAEQAACKLTTTGLTKDLMVEALTQNHVKKEVAKAAVEKALLSVENVKAATTSEILQASLRKLGLAFKSAAPFIIIGGLIALSGAFSEVEGAAGNAVKLAAGILLLGTTVVLAVKMANGREIRSKVLLCGKRRREILSIHDDRGDLSKAFCNMTTDR